MIEIVLEKVVIRGFGSFKDEQSFLLNRKPGLYFITGNNLVEPRLGSNGTGKTTLFSSIVWCLFGKTIRGTRGAVLKNGSSDSSSVSLYLSKDEKLYTVTRTQYPNSLSISPPILENDEEKENIVQEDIDNFLNTDYEKFLYQNIAGQFNSTFLDLGPTDKLNLFSDIMSLNFWEQCSKQASEVYTNAAQKIEILSIEQKAMDSSLLDLKAEEEAFLTKQRAFHESRDKEIEKLRAKAKEIEREVLEVTKQSKIYTQFLEEIDSGLEDDIFRIDHNIELINKDLTSTFLLIAGIITDKGSTTEELEKWKKLDVCPYCESTVNSDIIKQHKLEATKKLININKDNKLYKTKIEELEKQLQANREKKAEINNNLAEQKKNISKWTELKSIATTTKNLKSKELRDIKESIRRLENGEDPFESLIKDINIRKMQHILNKEKLDIKAAELNKSLVGNQFWVKGFKELRLWMVSDALAALEFETNNIMAKLGLFDWTTKFQMERETTSGGVSKGFHVLIKPPAADSYIPLEVYSGGETHRLKIAAMVGLSQLIQNYKGVNFNISIWDEQTTHLSSTGIEELLSFLQDEAIAKNKIIFFIDQHYLENTKFRSVITVEKTKDGSRIIE